MGFMERFKAKSRGNGATAELSPFDEMVVPHGAERSNAGASTVTLDMHASPTRQISTSIISEAAPSELAPDFNESRPQSAMSPMVAAALPIIGNKTVPEQQRILGGVVLLGLLGLVLGTVLALSAASRGANQVAAVGIRHNPEPAR